jgi:hypothetical protein
MNFDTTTSARPILERISGLLPSLRRSERKVADAVLSSPGRIMHSTMAQLAALADVSEPTVMRFCNAVGTDGFQSFRIELAQSLALGLPATHSAISMTDSPVIWSPRSCVLHVEHEGLRGRDLPGGRGYLPLSIMRIFRRNHACSAGAVARLVA